MTVGFVEATVVAQNTGTTVFAASGKFTNLQIDMDTVSFTGTVTLKRKFTDKGDDTLRAIETFTSSVNQVIEEKESGVEYQLFVETGDFAGTSVYLRLSN